MVNVVVKKDIVVLLLNIVLLHKDVNLNLVNVRQVVVENFGVHVLKDNVVVKKDIVEPIHNTVLLPLDVNQNMVNV